MTTLTVIEGAVYDRQVRLWGTDAQKRLQDSHVFIGGLTVLGSEISKNLVLAGINVTLQDAYKVTADCVESQFLFDHNDVGIQRTAAALPKVQGLNPLVEVKTETRKIEELDDDFFVGNFTIICLVQASKSVELRLDKLCREHGMGFISLHTFGSEGYLFMDLGPQFDFYRKVRTSSEHKDARSESIRVSFPPLEQSHSMKWGEFQKIGKRAPLMPLVFIKHQLLRGFQSLKKSRKLSEDLVEEFDTYAREQCVANGLGADFLDSTNLSQLLLTSDCELVPICSVLGGVGGREIIKAISRQDEPVCNCFLFDGVMGYTRYLGFD